MKKIVKIILIAFLIFPLCVSAKESASISAPSSVEVGSTFTVNVSLKDMNGWDINIDSSGQTSGCSTHEVGDLNSSKNGSKTFSVKCKATATGSIGITVSGTVSDADSNENEVSASKRISVIPQREKSADANLASLSLEGYDLSPTFSKDTLEYSVTVPSTVNSIKINAKVNESHASLTGTGEFEVSEGINPFEVVVTAETGIKKTYIINVNVEDTNPIEVKIGEDSYTLVKNAKNLTKPDFYEEKTVEINGFSIPAFYSEVTNFTLIGIKDMFGSIHLAIYNESNNTYTIYNETNSIQLVLYLTDFPNPIAEYTKSIITVNDLEVPVYKYKEDSRFVICYGMDIATGKYDYYRYDTKEGTFQIWDQEVEFELKNEIKIYFYLCIAFGAGLFLSFILIVILLHKKKNKTKKNQKEESKFPILEEKQEKISKLEKFDRFDIQDEEE